MLTEMISRVESQTQEPKIEKNEGWTDAPYGCEWEKGRGGP